MLFALRAVLQTEFSRERHLWGFWVQVVAFQVRHSLSWKGSHIDENRFCPYDWPVREQLWKISMPVPEDHEEKEVTKIIPLNYVFPEGQEIIFSNYALVQHDEFEFSMSFFQIRKPIFFPNDPNRQKKLEEMESIDALCVASVSMSLSRLPSLIAALQTQLEANQPESSAPSEPQ